MSVSQSDLLEVFIYNPDTGFFVNREYRGPRALPGQRSGSFAKDGYRRLKVRGHTISEHRAAWLYHYGTHPEGQIDHINGDPSDNRIANLREATNAENQQNLRKKRNTISGVTGVTWNSAKKKWQARIGIRRSRVFLGYFGSLEDAAEAYESAKRHYHVFNPELRA